MRVVPAPDQGKDLAGPFTSVRGLFYWSDMYLINAIRGIGYGLYLVLSGAVLVLVGVPLSWTRLHNYWPETAWWVFHGTTRLVLGFVLIYRSILNQD